MIRLENILKTSSKRFGDVLKMSCRRFEDVLKMSWRRLEDVLKTTSKRLEDDFKTSWRRMTKMSNWWRRQLLQHELSSLGIDHCILLDNLHNVKKLAKFTPIQVITISMIIYCYLAVPRPTFGHSWWDIWSHQPDVNHCFCKILTHRSPGA